MLQNFGITQMLKEKILKVFNFKKNKNIFISDERVQVENGYLLLLFRLTKLSFCCFNVGALPLMPQDLRL